VKIGDWYKAKRQIVRKGKTLLDLTLNQLAGIDPVSDEQLEELCKSGYACAKKERLRRKNVQMVRQRRNTQE